MKRFILFFLLVALTATTVSAQPGVIRRQQHTTTPTKPNKPTKPTKPTKPSTTKPTSPTIPISYKSCPDGNHPHMIDLGLPSGTKWACCNVGANKPEDYGGLYAWGEMEERSGEYSWHTYKLCNGSAWGCKDLGSNICGTGYDVAHVKWGGSWQMPTEDQIIELKDKCKHVWTTQNGVEGRKFTGPNGRSIFLPAAGQRWETDLQYRGREGNYWSGTVYGSGPSREAYILYCRDETVYTHFPYRCKGNSVRPVSK